MSTINRVFVGVILIGVLALAIGTARTLYTYLRSGESTAKTEWSVVEGMARKTAPWEIGVERVQYDGVTYIVLRLVTIDGRQSWILLNPTTEPLIKQVPRGDYLLTHKDFELIEAIPEVSDVVLTELKKHVSDEVITIH